MVDDVLRTYGGVFLGSRLKRLGERLQVGAARVIADAGLPVQPAHMPLLAALDGSSLTVGELVQAVGTSQPGVTRSVGQLIELGLVRSDAGEDQRMRHLTLTDAGQAAMARARHRIWPAVGAAVAELCGEDSDDLLDRIGALEHRLAVTPLDVLTRRMAGDQLIVHDFSDDLADHFHDINAEWIEAMFRLEETDRAVLTDPQGTILASGGAILFVEAAGLGIVGTCALQKTGESSFELTKMGVRSSARGVKAGEHLLRAAIARAAELGADPLYLLTNHRCAAAIHLYEKIGFEHDAGIMQSYGARYQRCDVAMRYSWPDMEKAPE